MHYNVSFYQHQSDTYMRFQLRLLWFFTHRKNTHLLILRFSPALSSLRQNFLLRFSSSLVGLFVYSKPVCTNLILYGLNEFVWQLLLICRKICTVGIALDANATGAANATTEPEKKAAFLYPFFRSLSLRPSSHHALYCFYWLLQLLLIRFSISFVYLRCMIIDTSQRSVQCCFHFFLFCL